MSGASKALKRRATRLQCSWCQGRLDLVIERDGQLASLLPDEHYRQGSRRIYDGVHYWECPCGLGHSAPETALLARLSPGATVELDGRMWRPARSRPARPNEEHGNANV